jgi:NAD(P)-dependent dehydrogenase (short-subunit alcohol dehydrogenase family)
LEAYVANSNRPVCAIVGVGPGLGAALARRFGKEYAVALIARGEDKLVALAKEIENAGGKALAVPADVAKAADITAAFDQVRRELGEVDALLYNAAMRPFGKLMDTKPSTFENTWRVSTLGAFLAAQEVVPAMLKRGSGTIIFTGATAGIKPFATSAAFGPAKFALRGLAQVMARDLQPQGVHVAYVNVDGAIDMPAIRERFPQLAEDAMLKPSAIAETYWFLAHQDRRAWSHDVDVRPFKEKW